MILPSRVIRQRRDSANAGNRGISIFYASRILEKFPIRSAVSLFPPRYVEGSHRPSPPLPSPHPHSPPSPWKLQRFIRARNVIPVVLLPLISRKKLGYLL